MKKTKQYLTALQQKKIIRLDLKEIEIVEEYASMRQLIISSNNNSNTVKPRA